MVRHDHFPKTRWSLIFRVGAEQESTALDALAELLRDYQPALQDYLVRYRRMNVDEAEEVVQGFIADKVMADRLLEQATATRGRFRSFLLRSLDNYRISRHRSQTARKRQPDGGVGALDAATGHRAPTPDAAASFDVAWARQLVHRCIDRFRVECEAAGDVRTWALFEQRVLKPTLEGEEPVAYEAMIDAMGFRSPREASNALVTAKRRFGRVLRREISAYVRDPDELEEELHNLLSVLSLGGAAGSQRLRTNE